VLFRQELDSGILYCAYIAERRGCINVEKKRKQEPVTAAYKEKKCRNATDWNEAPYI
jgi:hypothetical protein